MTENQLGSDLGAGLDEISMMVERGSLDTAQAEAQQLLLRYPNSAAVHAALGDVAAARHQHREAIEWYELSLRLEQTANIRERLARERDRLEQERLEEFEESLPPARDNRLLIAGVAAGFVVLVVVVAIVASLSGRHRGGPPTSASVQGRPGGRVGGVEQPAAAATSEPRPAARAGSRTTTTLVPVPGTAPRAGQSSSLRVTQSVDAPMADQDVLLTRALASLTWPSGEALGWRAQALVDPFTGYAMVTAELPPGMRGGELFPPIMDMSYRLAVATIHADQGVETLTIRILTPVTNDKGRSVTLVAFRGNTSREALDYYLKRGIEPDRQTVWSHVFATTWWNPSVPTGEAGAAAGASASGG